MLEKLHSPVRDFNVLDRCHASMTAGLATELIAVLRSFVPWVTAAARELPEKESR
jgi:hypothetical protein